MSRRRLVMVVGAVALIVTGAAWWVFSPALSANERALVGTWLSKSSIPGGGISIEFRADRTCTWMVYFIEPHDATLSSEFSRWSIWGDRLSLDFESSAVRRVLRPVASRIGVATKPAASYRLSFVTPDEIVVTGNDLREVFTRAPTH